MPNETKAERTAREAKERQVEVQAEVDAVADELATEEYNDTQPPEDPDAITIVRQETPENGVVWVVAQVLGNVKVDQVATGLRLAAKRVDKELLGS